MVDSAYVAGRPWVLVARLGGVGDNLIASSPIPLLAQKYNVEVLSQEPCHTVFENNPYVSKLTVKKPGAIADDFQAWFADRATDYEHMFNLSHSCESLVAFFRSQTHFSWPIEWRRKWCDHNYLEIVHDVCGVPYDFNLGGPRFFPTDEEMQKALKTKALMGEKVVGWCIRGTRLDKIYPYASFAIARLIKELNVSVVLFGSPGKDHELASLLLKDVTAHNGSFEGLHEAISVDEKNPAWPLRRTLTQAQTCDLVIGPDTGLMWGVAMKSIPKILMLGHASKKNITDHWVNTVTLQPNHDRVPCHPCHLLHDFPAFTCKVNEDKSAAACISDISVEMILQAAKRALYI